MLTIFEHRQLQNNLLEGCFDETFPTDIVCDVSNNPLTCYPAQCTFTSLSPAFSPEGSQAPATTDLAVPLGVSISIGSAVIAGIVMLVIVLRRRKKKQQKSELLNQSGNAHRLSQVLPSNMIIQFKDLKVGKELGFGDFGKVFEGEWQKSKVAIKVSTSEDVESFYNEAELMLYVQDFNRQK